MDNIQEIDPDNDERILKRTFDIKTSNNGLGWELYMAMKKYSKKTAQIIAETDEKQTFEQLLQCCVRTAINLRSKGFRKDDIVGICSGNHKYTIVPYFAALFLGMRVVAYDMSVSVTDMTYLLKQVVTPKILFAAPEAVQLIEASMKEANAQIELVVFGDADDDHETFSDYLEAHDDEKSFEPIILESDKETAVIFFSSGTTGLPKGICNSHYGLLCHSLIVVSNGNVGPICLYYTSLYWISSVCMSIALIMSGQTRVVAPKFSEALTWILIEKYKITSMFLPPFQIVELIKSGKPKGLNTTSLVNFFTGGGPLSMKYFQQLREMLPGTLVYQAYGETEIAGTVVMFDLTNPDDRISLQNKPESCGRPIPGVSYKLVDVETEETVGVNQPGELRLKSEFMMNGYFNMDASGAFDSNGWMKTGDLVYYDEEECFYIVGRLKELIKYKSIHVQPSLLENILMQHPAIQRALVLGIPHDEDGEHPMALVILNENFEDVEAKHIQNFVDSKVSDLQKLRAGVKIVTKIPVTSTGKTRRLLIRNMILAGEL